MHKFALLLSCSLLLGVVFGCSGAQQTDSSERLEDARSRFTDDGFLERRFDSNFDGQTDVWKYFRILADDGTTVDDPSHLRLSDISNMRLHRVEMDMTADGKVDIRRFYDHRERLVRETIHSAALGTRSMEQRFEDDHLTQRLVDLNDDGHFDQVWYFRQGQLQHVEFDDTGDGRPNRWHYFRDDTLVRIGRDITGDGVIDRWQVLQRESGELELRTGEGRDAAQDAEQ